MPIFVAEVAGNHHQDLDRCFAYIDKAAEIGCDAIKFQLFKINRLFSREILLNSAVHRDRKSWELPHKFIPKIAKYCAKKGIQFGCTPFDIDSVKILSAYVKFYKIASYELLYADLLKACAKTEIKILLSTGMATIPEINHAIQILRTNGCPAPIILHCVSDYPTLPTNANLAAIETIRNETNCEVGWSDHTGEPGVLQRAINRWRATVIEFHLDLDGTGIDCQQGHCWNPKQIELVIKQSKIAISSDGNGVKKPSKNEQIERMWRADPEDGLRPLKVIRQNYCES